MNRVAVFCGSSDRANPHYLEAAASFGGLLARRGQGLVYGGSSVGLMGRCADAALEEGGEVHGVLPRGLFGKEIAHRGLTALHVVESMHERKAMMAQLADGFVALPGGIGTLEELFEVWTWAVLGIHRKPVGLLDVDGFFSSLVVFLDRLVADGLMTKEHRGLLFVDDDASRLLDRMASGPPTVAPRYLDPSES